MPRFSLRTLLILTAMLGVLLAQKPYTRLALGPPDLLVASDLINPPSIPVYIRAEPHQRVLTDRFKTVAIAEGVILAVWAGAVFCRRRFPEISDSN